MIYLVIALKSEVQAFVDRDKLKKTKLGKYTLFYDETKKIILSGIGVINAREATQALINQYDITDDDIYINIGICGAVQDYEIGSLLEIGEVVYDGIAHPFKKSKKSLVCVDEAISEAKYDVVDMESYGFLDAVTHSPAIKNFHILKVVSDNFKPESVTKEKTKSLIFKVINDINKLIII
ncbi:hypothetical protein JHD49_03855 [Sulfurimonas sp. SAG-AH-194-C21]|nr:hypothetical protein [Sulfurimonas sp. SAG-AH-194-C21]MDF1883065.1 hypothetical protein [Sulfurimonas sp. SAG-AH-194-C21]